MLANKDKYRELVSTPPVSAADGALTVFTPWLRKARRPAELAVGIRAIPTTGSKDP
jgi:hypothetical protein